MLDLIPQPSLQNVSAIEACDSWYSHTTGAKPPNTSPLLPHDQTTQQTRALPPALESAGYIMSIEVVHLQDTPAGRQSGHADSDQRSPAERE